MFYKKHNNPKTEQVGGMNCKPFSMGLIIIDALRAERTCFRNKCAREGTGDPGYFSSSFSPKREAEG